MRLLLSRMAVLQRHIDFAILEEIFPRILVFTLE